MNDVLAIAASRRQVLSLNVGKEENINTFIYAYVKTYVPSEKKFFFFNFQASEVLLPRRCNATKYHYQQRKYLDNNNVASIIIGSATSMERCLTAVFLLQQLLRRKAADDGTN